MNEEQTIQAITDEQYVRIGDRLHDTGQNVYMVAESVVGRTITEAERDEVWLKLSEIADIFKCEECGTWKTLSEKVGWRDNFCTGCEAIENGEEPDDE